MQEQSTDPVPRQEVVELLIRAGSKEELQRILKLYPMLRQPDLDGWLTQKLNQEQNLLDRFIFLCAREFLAGFLAKNTDAARQLMPSLPMVESYPGTLLLKQANSATPAQLVHWAERAFLPLRPGQDDELRSVLLIQVARLLADTRAAARRGQIPSAAKWTARAQRHVLQTAAGYAREAMGLYGSKPEHKENWKAALRLVDELYQACAQLEPIPTGSTPAEQFDWSIAAYEQLIQQEDWHDAAFELACLRHSLGKLYIHYPGEAQVTLVEQGLGELKQALILLGNEAGGEFSLRLEDLPIDDQEQSARSLNALGSAYLLLSRESRLENIHQAMVCYQSASKVKTGADAIQRQAEGHFKLAVASRICAQEDPQNAEKILRESILMTQIHLAEEKRQQFPAAQQAELQAELGKLYFLVQTYRQKNLGAAIHCYEQALASITREQQPLLWAHVQSLLGAAWYEAAQGQPEDTLAAAREHFILALEAYEQQRSRQEWADMHHRLGIICVQESALLAAQEHFWLAQGIRQVEVMPETARQTAMNRGDLEFRAESWQKAFQAYQVALRAGELLFQDALSETSKKAELANLPMLYQRAAYAAVQAVSDNEKPERGAQAIKILEQGKTRLLSHALHLTTPRPKGVKTAIWQEFEQAAQQLRRLQILAEYETSAVGNPERSLLIDSDHQRAIYQRFEQAVNQVRHKVPGFLQAPDLVEIQALLPDETTALIAFCVTEQGSLGLIVRKSAPHVAIVPIPAFNRTRLNAWLFSYDGWVAANRRKAAGNARGETLLSQLSQELLAPVLAELESATPAIQKLIILPTGGLSLAPMHAAPLSEDARLIDRYQISYIPSIQMLHNLVNHQDGAAKDRLAAASRALHAVIGPQVVYPELMRYALQQHWNSAQIDEGQQATLFENGSASGTARHFYGQGHLDWNAPLQSGLFLADRELTLGELQHQAADLSKTGLLTLTMCESNRSEALTYPEEYIGLPAGFIQAGIPCVVSTLWPVPELASALLMGEFYEGIRQGDSPAIAIQQAQRRIREMTNRQVSEVLNRCIDTQPCGAALREACQRRQEQAAQNPDAQPFHDAYWWAAFSLNGLGQF